MLQKTIKSVARWSAKKFFGRRFAYKWSSDPGQHADAVQWLLDQAKRGGFRDWADAELFQLARSEVGSYAYGRTDAEDSGTAVKLTSARTHAAAAAPRDVAPSVWSSVLSVLG